MRSSNRCTSPETPASARDTHRPRPPKPKAYRVYLLCFRLTRAPPPLTAIHPSPPLVRLMGVGICRPSGAAAGLLLAMDGNVPAAAAGGLGWGQASVYETQLGVFFCRGDPAGSFFC